MSHTITALSQTIDEKLESTLQDLEQAEKLLVESNSDTTHIKQARRTIEEVRRQTQTLCHILKDTTDKAQQGIEELQEHLQAIHHKMQEND